jgi:hypothetical protein
MCLLCNNPLRPNVGGASDLHGLALFIPVVYGMGGKHKHPTKGKFAAVRTISVVDTALYFLRFSK